MDTEKRKNKRTSKRKNERNNGREKEREREKEVEGSKRPVEMEKDSKMDVICRTVNR